MLAAGLGISTLLDSDSAGRQAAERAVARLDAAGPDLALIVVSAAHGQGLPRAVRAARNAIGARVVGASVEGIVAPDVEVSSYPAVLVLALATEGSEVAPFFVRDAASEPGRVGDEIAARVGELAEDDLVVLLADSHSIDPNALSKGLAGPLNGAAVLGAGAAPIPRGRPLLWDGEDLASDAVVGWAMRGARPRLAIAQAGRAVTPQLRVTRARGNWVLGLGGRPALDVYQETARQLGLEACTESAPPLLVGFCDPPRLDGMGAGGRLRVRNVVGFDRDRRAFSVPEATYSGQEIALVELDPTAARADLAARLDELATFFSKPPKFGLYFNCRARGASLFGEPGVEASHLANVFADCPIAGVTGPFQIASMARGEAPVVLTYAGALALVDS
jgi:small ligand-binding sensory domain FIST